MAQAVCEAPENRSRMCHTSNDSTLLIPVSGPSDTASFASCATHRVVYIPGSTDWHKLCAKHRKTQSRMCHTRTNSTHPFPVSGPSDTASFATCATHRVAYIPGSTDWHKLCAKHRKPGAKLMSYQRRFDTSSSRFQSFGHSWLRNLCYPPCRIHTG